MATQKEPSFEEQLAQLQAIVNQLEQGNVPLEEALQQFQEGIKLAKKLQGKLNDAEKTLGHLIDDDGNERVYEGTDDDPSNNGGGNRGYGSGDQVKG
ncbi:MAG TPA: exodeoxyribonuclease VII small subunit [Candidatus Limosilactobacillus intestinigallinarum]|nr:exodeoxyribonuclease VII small subunit [Candidatus Limosilactobacillus intestinigallinarum]